MKNIILLITDTFRYDNLGDKAERNVRTPRLDRFAARYATSIEKFYTGSFPTIPHRTDLATGVLGWPHYGWQPIDLSGPNHVANLLRQAGYVSQLICDCPHLFPARFPQGFDAAFQHRGQEGDRPLLHLNDPIVPVMAREKTRTRPLLFGQEIVNVHRWTNRYYTNEAETFSARTSQTAVRWLEENYKANPFFLWVDFFDPHEPWDPPEYLVQRYDPDYTGPPMLHPNYGPASAYTPEELHNLWAHYAAEAELVDRMLGRVLQKINDLRLWNDSIVIVTADHGMSLGEHNRTGKSNLSDDDDRYWPIYPEIGHVPFLIAGGDVPRGESLDLMAQPIDILPSVFELAGVTVEPEKPFEGRSFADAVLTGTPGGRKCSVSGCFATAEGGAPPRKCTTPFLTTSSWGYAPVGADGTPELFDLVDDPYAENNLMAEKGDLIPVLHELLVAHLEEHGAPDACRRLWSGAARGDADGKWAADYQ